MSARELQIEHNCSKIEEVRGSELGPGLLADTCKQLGIRKEDL